jgi:hypothetical protein
MNLLIQGKPIPLPITVLETKAAEGFKMGLEALAQANIKC